MFSGKIVLITGASSGIGAGTALHFASEGAKLALTGRNIENLENVARDCKSKHNLAPLIVAGDLTCDDDVKNILETTITTYGKLDVLINNAGIFFLRDIMDLNMEEYDKTFATNVRSVYLLTTLALPYLIKTKGNIVNVSSIASLRPYPAFTPYCMTKAALDHFTKCVALDVASKQVRVNSVNPGVIPTNIHQRAGMSDADIQMFYGKVFHPIGRLGTVEDVAKAIVFLASENASFITGEIFTVDGGCQLNTL